jgi:hypothetical protein
MRASRRTETRFCVIVASAVLALCGVTRGASRPAPPDPQAVKADAGRQAHMQAHFSQAMAAHEAVIRGDLLAVTAPALWLANHDAPSALPAGSAPFVAQMKRAARRTAGTSSVLEAALGTADMLKTCGDCHRAVGTMPAPLAHAPAPDVAGMVGHMLAHQQALDQMLQGLIVPSSASWRSGAEALRTAPLHTSELPDDPKLTASIAASEKRIHELARQAGQAENSGARAVFYGQILARCADCHTLHRDIWGPTRRR